MRTIVVGIVALGAGVALGVAISKKVAVGKAEGGVDAVLNRVGLKKDSQYGNKARQVAGFFIESLVN